MFGGNVDIEWSVIFGNPLPDVLNALQLRCRENYGIVIDVKLGCIESFAAGVPSGSDDASTVKVKVDGTGGARVAMQIEGLVKADQ